VLPIALPLSQIAVSYQSIEILQEHGINANDLQKLQGAGYHTVESVRANNVISNGTIVSFQLVSPPLARSLSLTALLLPFRPLSFL
jgi:hypothetical protein